MALFLKNIFLIKKETCISNLTYLISNHIYLKPNKMSWKGSSKLLNKPEKVLFGYSPMRIKCISAKFFPRTIKESFKNEGNDVGEMNLRQPHPQNDFFKNASFSPSSYSEKMRW